MEIPSRRLLVLCTFVQGLTVVIGFFIAKYASQHSPGVADIVFREGGKIIQRQEKDFILASPVLVQAFFFLVLCYGCLTWRRFVRRGFERTAEMNARRRIQVDFSKTYRMFCYGLFVWNACVLAMISYFALQVLGRQP